MTTSAIKSNLGIIVGMAIMFKLFDALLLPVAIAISMITVPLGYLAALWYTGKSREENRLQPSLLSRLWSPVVHIMYADHHANQDHLSLN